MPLRQIARTPSRPLPPRDGHGIPYAFAVEVRVLLDRYLSEERVIDVRCPWCGGSHTHPEGGVDTACVTIGRRYTVAIPAGTPVLA